MHEEPLRKGEQTQARILDAAYALFMEQGYHGTSMRQIVERAGITMGGVYNHFASKEEIWVAVLFDRHPYRAVAPMLRAADGDTTEAFVRNAAQRLVGELSQRKDLLHIMFIELVEFNGVHIPALYTRIAPELEPLIEVVRARADGLRTLPLPMLARSFLGFFFSYYVTDMLMPPAVRAMMDGDGLDAFLDIYLHGVLAEEGTNCEGRGALAEPRPSGSDVVSLVQVASADVGARGVGRTPTVREGRQ